MLKHSWEVADLEFSNQPVDSGTELNDAQAKLFGFCGVEDYRTLLQLATYSLLVGLVPCTGL